MLSPKHKLTSPVHFPDLMPPGMQEKFDAMGGDGFFGPLVEKKANVWLFQNGAVIYEFGSKTVHEIHGEIYKKWRDLGGTDWGHPTCDETATTDGKGRYNHFTGEKSIYWSPATGAAGIWGDIRKRWAEMGWETSYLGYPTSDEVDFPQGGRANSFEHGGIYWWPDTGAVDLGGVALQYTGLRCIREMSKDQATNSDEPYVIISVDAPEGTSTKQTRVYGDVDSGELVVDNVIVYEGPPLGLNLASLVMEHDNGDPEAMRRQVEAVANRIHEEGKKALEYVPFVGPVLAKAAKELDGVIPKIAEALAKALDLGDDIIGRDVRTLSARDMVTLARGKRHSDGPVLYALACGPVRGGGGAYTLYYNILPR